MTEERYHLIDARNSIAKTDIIFEGSEEEKKELEMIAREAPIICGSTTDLVMKFVGKGQGRRKKVNISPTYDKEKKEAGIMAYIGCAIKNKGHKPHPSIKFLYLGFDESMRIFWDKNENERYDLWFWKYSN